MNRFAFLSSRAEFERVAGEIDKWRGPIERSVLDRETCDIWCRACGGLRVVRTLPWPRGAEWINLHEAMVCEGCGLNGRMRMILKALDVEFAAAGGRKALVFERVTQLFPHLLARFPGLLGCEFLPGEHKPGDTVEFAGVPVRHENMMDLSFPDESFDVVMHYDVLEHVPDWRRGLAQCHRVLRPGGQLVFTLPFFYRLERNIVRAEVRDGALVHHLPPGYHGNPVDGSGALVYIHPSWELLEGLEAAGFSGVRIAFCFDPMEGVLSSSCPFPNDHTWPAVFFATR